MVATTSATSGTLASTVKNHYPFSYKNNKPNNKMKEL
jgi:hypothetical protein